MNNPFKLKLLANQSIYEKIIKILLFVLFTPVCFANSFHINTKLSDFNQKIPFVSRNKLKIGVPSCTNTEDFSFQKFNKYFVQNMPLLKLENCQENEKNTYAIYSFPTKTINSVNYLPYKENTYFFLIKKQEEGRIRLALILPKDFRDKLKATYEQYFGLMKIGLKINFANDSSDNYEIVSEKTLSSLLNRHPKSSERLIKSQFSYTIALPLSDVNIVFNAPLPYPIVVFIDMKKDEKSN